MGEKQLCRYTLNHGRKHTWLAYLMLATLLIYHLLFMQREAQTLAGTQG